MSPSGRFYVLVVTLLLCQCLTEVQCRRTIGSSQRSQSSGRRSKYGSSQSRSQPSTGQGSFFSFFGSKKPSSSSSSSSAGKTSSSSSSSSGWTSAKQASTNQQSPGWANPYYKPSAPPKQPSTYGWTAANSKKPEASSSQFQKSGQPSSNIGPGGYPVQSGATAQRYPQQSHGYNPAPQSPHPPPPPPYSPPQQGFNSAPHPPAYSPPHPPAYSPPQSHAYNPAPSSGFNAGHQQPHGYNTGYQSPPSYQSSFPNPGGYHPTNNFGQQGFASGHGLSPGHYPQQSGFGYPGQGMFGGGSHGPTYRGQGLFGGSGGSFGYPGGGNWGYPSYGSKGGSGKGKLLTGLALGAAGGYLTSSLVNKISNPWGYGGYGYGSRFGYDRPIVIKEIRETTKTVTDAPEPDDPTKNWIHCVAFDPATNETLINPNCSCTVTTIVDPATNLPISTHNCTTANGQVLPPLPVGAPVAPPNAVNNPDASPSYGGLYQDGQRYGMPPGSEVVETAASTDKQVETASAAETTATTGEEASTTTTTAETSADPSMTMMNDSPPRDASLESPSPKVKEFFSQLEQIVNMGKFV